MADLEASAFPAAQQEAEDGFSSIAHSFASDPDNETFVFKKFDELGALNLLYLQCEMMDIQAQLSVLDDRAQDTSLRGVMRWWEAMRREADNPESCRREVKQKLELIHGLRRATQEYRKH